MGPGIDHSIGLAGIDLVGAHLVGHVDDDVAVHHGVHCLADKGQGQVGDNSFIGAGATVIQGIHVGSGSIVGAGSSVVKKVDDNTLVYGKTVKRL